MEAGVISATSLGVNAWSDEQRADMIARVHSSTLQGIDAIGGEVEADVAVGGMAEIKLVGMADTAVKESVSRIQAALRNSGYRWPGPKVTINLAPADVKKVEAERRSPGEVRQAEAERKRLGCAP